MKGEIAVHWSTSPIEFKGLPGLQSVCLQNSKQRRVNVSICPLTVMLIDYCVTEWPPTLVSCVRLLVLKCVEPYCQSATTLSMNLTRLVSEESGSRILPYMTMRDVPMLCEANQLFSYLRWTHLYLHVLLMTVFHRPPMQRRECENENSHETFVTCTQSLLRETSLESRATPLQPHTTTDYLSDSRTDFNDLK